MFWSVPFYLIGCLISNAIDKKASSKVEECKIVTKCLDEFIAELSSKSDSNQKSKYRMKEIDNEEELFFTDATDFNEAFKL